MGYVQRFDRVPPMLCRLLARTGHGTRLMTVSEICEKSGLSRPAVIRISRLASWRDLPLGISEHFSSACGVNLLAPGQQLKFLRRRKRKYWERANPEQRKMIARLLTNLNVTK
jgi:hypothetical protein